VTKADLGSHLEGPGANVELVGFLCGEGKQHFDHHTVHDHRAPHTYSDLDFKVVLKDKARSAYTGLIRIEPDAPQSEAYQENRNLLLTEGAKAESIPELEILTDDVKCTHGATMGNLDPEHLFYLMSRGLSRGEALRLIVGGFIEPTLSRIPEDLRERLRDHVEDRIKEL
jgi:Fe-S cluster assembly protein SufD